MIRETEGEREKDRVPLLLLSWGGGGEGLGFFVEGRSPKIARVYCRVNANYIGTQMGRVDPNKMRPV